MNLILCAFLVYGGLSPATPVTTSTDKITSEVIEGEGKGEGSNITPVTNNRRERRGNGGRGAKD